ncbi:Transcriptional regulator, TetR family [Euzebya pacifica]|uniref:Transcriptional regulator, TetR family n=1 Tax=Euzebya pacifica TaxID=1608957 RepID=A0A346Y3G7_9ACTN|nr:TetR family transcriptional regulator [Euzebya pacifica]AXV09014.1 Transcriptional regulator, TetR family [Euzebya pacifica]
MSTTRQRQALASRRRIADAALELFAAHGVAATSTRSIAARAGVSEGLVFRYFPTKRDLLDGVVADGPTIAAALRDVVDGAGAKPVRTVAVALAERFADLASSEAALLSVLIGESRTDAVLHAAFTRAVDDAAGALADYLAERVAAGEVDAGLDRRAAAQQLIGGLLLILLTAAAPHDDHDRHPILREEARATTALWTRTCTAPAPT